MVRIGASINLSHVSQKAKTNQMFPFAFAINTFSMTILFMSFGVIGRPALAADIAIVQGATLALFLAFSANARNLILNPDNKISTASLLQSRVVLILPLGLATFILSTGFTQIDSILVLILIVRRCAEWISELHLSDMERNNRKPRAKIFILIQLSLLLLAVYWKLNAQNFKDLGIFLWAIVPMAVDAKFIWSNLNFKQKPSNLLLQLFPHFGSTAITGITVFLFRLSLIILLGKSLTGDLLTAFAMGGLMSSIFNSAIGPSLVHNQDQIRPLFSVFIKSFFWIYCLLGMLIWLMAPNLSQLLAFIGKSDVFLTAFGSSMIGSCIMTISLKIRIGMLQNEGNKDVFGQDLVINLLILAFTIFSYYIFGDWICNFLFLVNAIISFVVYGSSKLSMFSEALCPQKKILLSVLCGLLVFPIFFQLSGHIFSEPFQYFDSQGNLFLLPIPISVIICFSGILLIGNYENSRVSLYVIFFSFITMLLTILITKQGNPLDKLILMIQFVLPMFGMVFGQMFFKTSMNLKPFAKSAFIVVASLMLVQLAATYFAKTNYLSAYLYFFSIYQHLQYVPTIFIALYLLALFSLWDEKYYKRIHLVLSPFVGIYAMLSLSMVTLSFLCAGLIAFVSIKTLRGKSRLPILLALVIMASVIFTHSIIRNTDTYLQKFDFVESSLADQNENNLEISKEKEYRSNISGRMQIWDYYLNGILESPYKFVFGNAKRPDRELYHSAHNYYLDVIYNFGFFALIPIGALLISTLILVFRNKRDIMHNLTSIGLVFITIFLLIGDNSVKVGMRQPYPGIITFFLWGMLLSRFLPHKKQSSLLKQ